MNIPDLIRDLEEAGVSLWEDDGELRFRAPRGALTKSRRAALRESKTSVLECLRTRSTKDQIEPNPLDATKPFPLTDIQAAYLFGRRNSFAYGGVGCHGYAEFVFPSLDPAAAESVWRALIQRHPALRTVIDSDGTQRVLARVPDYKIRVADLRTAPPSVSQTAVTETRREMDHRLYEPSQWPLFDLRITLTPDNAVLHFSLDLLVSDFSSTQILLAEFNDALLNRNHTFAPLALTFRDYCMELAKRGESTEARTSREYWLARLDEFPPAPDLPLRLRELEKPRFRRWHLKLDQFDWAALLTVASRQGITPSTILLAVFSEVLSRWASNRRFALNITLQQRAQIHKDVNRIVGDFTTLNLLSIDKDSGQTFLDRAHAIQHRLWEDMDHQSFSGSQVMRELTRRHGRPALYPIVFTSSIGANGGREWPVMQYGITQTPQVWLDCQAAESQGGLFLNWDVREGIFPDGVIEAMFSSFKQLLGEVQNNPSIWQQKSPVNLPPIQVQGRKLANATGALLPDALLHQGIVERLLKEPDRVSIIAADGSLTNGDLLARALGLARALRAAGVRRNDFVAVLLNKGWAQPVAVLAILLCDAAYVPVEANQPPARRNLILGDSAVRIAVAHSISTNIENWPPGVDLIFVDAVESSPIPDHLPPAMISCDDPAYLIYTSGSTGTPKGVVVSHRSAVNTIQDINQRFHIGSSDCVLGLSSLGFDLSVYDIFGVLAAGGRLVLPDPKRRTDPSHWARLIADHGVTIWNSVPALLQVFCQYLQSDKSRQSDLTLRLALLSGDWIPLNLPEQIRRFWPNVRRVSLGGATEAAIWSIFYEISEIDPEWTSIPYGRPLANQRWYVLDHGLQACPDFVPGQLYIAGTGLAIGYWQDPQKTADRFIFDSETGERLYRTGDWGRYLPDGTIEFLGRDDRQVKIRGHRIELAEVEAALIGYPAVAHAAVIVDQSARTEKRLCAFVTTKVPLVGDVATQINNIKTFLATKLPEYMVPWQLQIVEGFPITSNGKIDATRLQSMIIETAPVPPSVRSATDLERRLGSIWSRSLGLSDIDHSKGFVTLGGDSLRAAQVVGCMREELQEARHLFFDELLMPLLADKSLTEIASFLESHADPSDVVDNGRSRLVSLRSIVSGTQKTALVVATEISDLFRFSGWEAYWRDYTILVMEISDAEALKKLSSQSLVGAVADACVDVLIDSDHLRIEIIGLGNNGVLGLEIARRMTESGALVDQLYVVPDSFPQNDDGLAGIIARGLTEWEVDAYAGDLTLLLTATSGGLEDQHRAYWTSICLGEVKVDHAG